MDFRDSPAEAEFRAPAARLARRQQPRPARRRRPTTSTGPARPSGTASLYDAGFFGLSWPDASIGGHDLPTVFDVILDEELAAAGAPPAPEPRLPRAGHHRRTAATRSRTASCPASISGRERWCQGFSEPDAGSDLASLRTTRRRATATST